MSYRSRLTISRRTGCTTCKERHKKCDEQKPRCTNCTRLDLTCKQPDLFRASRLSRSYTRRVCRVDTALNDAGHLNSGPHEPNECTESLIDNNSDTISTSPTSSFIASCFNLIPPTWTKPLPTPQASPIEDYLMQHYIERSSSVLVNVDGPTNSLRNIILPRAVTSPMLINALYATSSLHVSIYNDKPEYRLASLTYYNKASTSLHHSIADLGSNTTVKDRELTLLTSVFLCKYEIVSGGLANWRLHLRGLQRMFSMFQRNEAPLSPEIVSYIQSFIAYHWWIAGITRTERLSSHSTISNTDEEMERELVLGNQIDPYMGVSGQSISLLHSAAQIIMFDFAKEPDLSTIMSQVMKIYHIIKPNVRASESFDPCVGITPEMITHLDHIADGYRNALIVYLHIILDGVIRDRVSDAIVLQSRRIRSLLSYTKDEAISACMKDITRVPEESPSAVGLSPLLFIVASETRDRTELDIASRRLGRLWKKTCLGNIGTAVELLDEIRHANCLDWRQILKPRKWDLIVS